MRGTVARMKRYRSPHFAIATALACLVAISCGDHHIVTSSDEPAAMLASNEVPGDDPAVADSPIGDAVTIEAVAVERTDTTAPRFDEEPPVRARAFAYEVDPVAADGFVALINRDRSAEGLSTLATYWDLEDDALAHTERMIDAGHIYHNPNLADVAGPVWSRLGENVGVGGTVETLHQAFMNSPGHRANVLGDYTHVGIGVQRDAASKMWVTVVFMHTTVEGIENTYGPFVDDDFNTHEYGISRIAEEGITVGCDSTGRHFCPDDSVTRGQMATFLTRAFALPPSGSDHFTDDDGRWYEGPANALTDSGITKGCNAEGTVFCGDDAVTRGQMAAFLTRALSLPPASADYFDDDAGRFYEDSANRMYESGITRGCGGTKYCGEDNVTRAQMATFLTRALGL